MYKITAKHRPLDIIQMMHGSECDIQIYYDKAEVENGAA